MRELLAAGKIKAVGVSNYPLKLWQKAEKALGAAVVSNQVELHLLDRSPLDDLSPDAEGTPRIVIAYSPLAQGALGGRYRGGNLPEDFRRQNPLFDPQAIKRIEPLIEEMDAVGRSHGANVAQIALAWLLYIPQNIPQTLVIPGARSLEQVESNAFAASIELKKEEWQRLNSVAQQVAPPRSKRRFTRIAAALLGAR